MKERYIKIITGNGEYIFVLDKDMKDLKQAMKEKPFNAKKIVAKTLNVAINNPDGMLHLSEALFFAREIFRIQDINRLKSMRKLIDLQIKALKHKKLRGFKDDEET